MRCSKCLMPSFLPRSDFNAEGECSWCQTGYPNYSPIGIDKFQKLINQHKRNSSYADCLVGVSGGKDSSYVLLKLKTEFNLKVEAFTYNHFGLTDFALENARVVCQDLNIKHHIVSLPDNEHLKSFQTFFTVWLNSEKPIPAAMTCVACKHLHSLGSALAVERKIPMVVWSACPLEIPPMLPLKLASNRNEQFKRQGMLKSALQLTQEVISTQGFASSVARHFRTCTIGCLGVTPTSKYLRFRYPSITQIMFFDYFDWNAEHIITNLTEATRWRQPDEFPDDWHSDCVFNIFKEYMFQKMHGISYTDAFLSNQIRYGLILREKGWDILVNTKRFYASNIIKALDKVGLAHLSDKIDLSCFDVTEI